jgi:hypothetical protein
MHPRRASASAIDDSPALASFRAARAAMASDLRGAPARPAGRDGREWTMAMSLSVRRAIAMAESSALLLPTEKS